MSIDVRSYPDLLHAEHELLRYESEHLIGRFGSGQDQSVKIGDGLEIDGLREYVPGDDARHIDWRASARTGDGTLLLRQHFVEQAPLTVLVSDIPQSEKYAHTPGTPLSARALGFVVANGLLRSAVDARSPVVAYWTHGFRDKEMRSLAPKEGPKGAQSHIIEGLHYATRSEAIREQKMVQPKKGLFRREQPQIELDQVGLSEVFLQSVQRSKRIADTARFIVMSDFRIQDLDELMYHIKKTTKTSEVITVQVTNPLLRELPQDISLLQSKNKGSYIVETDAQREAYKRAAREKQRIIDDKLRMVSTHTFTIDTTDPRLAKKHK